MKTTDSNTPLHLSTPDYGFFYGIPSKEAVTASLKRILSYLEEATPAGLHQPDSRQEAEEVDEHTEFAAGAFRLTSYEWGVTYAGMLLAGKAGAGVGFTGYARKRLKMIADLANCHLEKGLTAPDSHSPVHTVVNPQALDDAGALCAAMIKAERAGLNLGLGPVVDNFMEYIRHKEFRLPDGTLARNRPYASTLWLDDLFMSVPALAQMGVLAGDSSCFDDAVKQVMQFSERMFILEKGLYRHGWVQHMSPHPAFCWGRANGWAAMAMVELLTVLPETHPGYADVLNQLRAHFKGLAACQSGSGFWHQLLDRSDSYLETSASAIISYSMARAVNLGIVDPTVFGPVAVLAWNAVAGRINDSGQVEGTCVGTGMGFDPAFYCHRPVNVFAAHGYGPVLLAGAEIIRLIETHDFEMNENALLLKKRHGSHQ